MIKVRIMRQEQIVSEAQVSQEQSINDILYQIDPNHLHKEKKIMMIIDLTPQITNSPSQAKDTITQKEQYKLKPARVVIKKKQNQNQEQQKNKEVPSTNQNPQPDLKVDQTIQNTDNQFEQDQDGNLNDFTTTRNCFPQQQQHDQEFLQKISQMFGSLQAKLYENQLDIKNEQIEQLKQLHLQQIQIQMDKQKFVEDKYLQELMSYKTENQQLNNKLDEQESELVNLQITLASYVRRMDITKKEGNNKFKRQK